MGSKEGAKTGAIARVKPPSFPMVGALTGRSRREGRGSIALNVLPGGAIEKSPQFPGGDIPMLEKICYDAYLATWRGG
ncbi:hypothetical protein [Oxynema aestuarii]|uniref:Uncharacterized protein n=1 Tax=Oxynema aestuarii AP17 TaxID=2064643 RepID=A0A6H1TZH1_9CYAN|nr:hypothetical protein [Oxynema aestuarii]QIZ71981.1 hypothetical protein HCG48_16475 [Oxynema aestuarii AP17]